jgi:hypothetical protein
MGWLSLEVAGGWHSHESSLLAPLYICLCDDPTDLPNEPRRPDPLTRPTAPTQKARSAERACAVAGWWASAAAGGRSYVNLSILDTSITLHKSNALGVGLWGIGLTHSDPSCPAQSPSRPVPTSGVELY